MTSKGHRPAIAPNPSGKRGIHLPLFGHHDKSSTLPPPAETPPAATTEAAVSQPDAQAAQPQAGQSATPAQSSQPKKGGFVHGVLGL
jgi:hypothetical protein